MRFRVSMLDRIYEEGYFAFRTNKSNPYQPGTIEYRSWKKGYDVAICEEP